nr:hypothetical protein [Tanacetum cinerariifolium]
MEEQLDDEPLDLLDRQKTQLFLRSSDNLKRKLQSDEEPELDANGRLIIWEDGKTRKRTPTIADLDARSQAGVTDDEPLDLLDRQKTQLFLRSSDNLKRKLQSDEEPELDANGRLIIWEDGKTQKRTHMIADLDARSQAGVTGKKAVGDMKRKGKLEPYSYWPLDRKMAYLGLTYNCVPIHTGFDHRTADISEKLAFLLILSRGIGGEGTNLLKPDKTKDSVSQDTG